MNDEVCSVCGGDGSVSNSFGGGAKRCPACHGTGRKAEDFGIFRDVTKTKPSHHRPQGAQRSEKQTRPATFAGEQLAKEVDASTIASTDLKARLIREIIEYENTHGTCTQTFVKKIRKQVIPKPATK